MQVDGSDFLERPLPENKAEKVVWSERSLVSNFEQAKNLFQSCSGTLRHLAWTKSLTQP
ncbi:hypothetical protein SynSYN20_00566 [Synechococcus sp. SYN20]|nr:hypothetical protein SynSYN20_00566 [Synechococcus sp. SYN20]